MNVESLKVFDV